MSPPKQAQKPDDAARLVTQLSGYFTNELPKAVRFFAKSHNLPLNERLKVLRLLEKQITAAICEQTEVLNITRETWVNRSDPAESPMEFAHRVYKAELAKGISVSELRLLDFELYLAMVKSERLSANDTQSLLGAPIATPRETPEQETARLSRLLSFRRPKEHPSNRN